jgi:pyocin large subunit-like protein
MAGFRTALGLALSISAAAAVLTACDNGPSAVRAESATAASAGGGADDRSSVAVGRDRGDAAPVDHRKDEVKLVEGKPLWSPSRRYTAEENAQRAFTRNGEAFGARSIDQYVKKAHAFVDHPPAGTQTLTRANGDTLFYDPKANVFAVANKDGAPRTMFKPDEGRAYWDKQKDRESQRQASRGSKRGSDDAA